MIKSKSRQEIQKEIEALQLQLQSAPQSPPAKKRKSEPEASTVLAPSTPSPRKKRKEEKLRARAQSPTNFTRRVIQTQPKGPVTLPTQRPSEIGRPRKSESLDELKKPHMEKEANPMKHNLLTSLKNLTTPKEDECDSVYRTDGFDEKPLSHPISNTTKRDDRLAIVEDLKPGPVDHKPIEDDPNFERIEPNSGIKLKSRTLPHPALQDHLYGRYFLPPSLLYSIVRLQANKQAYEVPVDGDWVTIAVVAERGDVKLTSGPGNFSHGKRDEGIMDSDDDADKNKKGANKKGEGKNGEDANARKGGKKYVHLKLIDLGHRSRTSSSSDTPRGSLRGDAQLSLLLFESDYFDKEISKENGRERVKKLWRGGSRGAFEEFNTRLREGTVIALLNPKVLKPFQNTKNSTSSSILALTPPSSSAIAIIGVAADLGRCSVTKRDGKQCGAWVDKRIGQAGLGAMRIMEDVCEYHIQTAVQRTRANRSEFSIGTSGMSTTARKGRGSTDYDPARQWGLKPENGAKGVDGELMYVFGGIVASSSRSTAPGITEQNIGREGQARAKRRMESRDSERQLALLLGKSNGSMSNGIQIGETSKEALEMVRRAAQKAPSKRSSKGFKNIEYEEPQKKAYSAEMLKCLGFNPAANPYDSAKSRQGDKGTGLASKFKKLESNRSIQLGPPPGAKKRSGVLVPTSLSNTKEYLNSPEESSDLEIEPPEQNKVSNEGEDLNTS